MNGAAGSILIIMYRSDATIKVRVIICSSMPIDLPDFRPRSHVPTTRTPNIVHCTTEMQKWPKLPTYVCTIKRQVDT